jgi:hypothetical protein
MSEFCRTTQRPSTAITRIQGARAALVQDRKSLIDSQDPIDRAGRYPHDILLIGSRLRNAGEWGDGA